MKEKSLPAFLLWVAMASSANPAWAQEPPADQSQVAVPNPYLLVIRDPAVHDELRLSDRQKQSVLAVTDALDGPFWASRNLQPAQRQRITQQLIGRAQNQVQTLLNVNQRQRLDEILLQLQGVRALLRPDVARRLQLDADQQEQIRTIIKETAEAVNALEKLAQSGKSRGPLEHEAKQLQRQEQKQVLAVLTIAQLRQWAAATGGRFDASRMQQARFKAPEFAASQVRLNSQPLKMSQLQGRVVALHFWAFG